ncbi:MAG: metallophosphoesterase family protein [Candidatus Zixiibacteriota bacterium]|nr:MAG: metallophosphoesterase family protein [candidate division Zixibacteria bacterium]
MFNLRDGPANIWVISDTHLRSGQILPDAFTRRAGREDIIIHLGDFVSPEIIKQLKTIARLEAISGNCDPPSIRKSFPFERIIEISGVKIALSHGWGGQTETVQRVKRDFEGKVDVALFGHTHSPYHAKSDGTVFFNPGSLSQSRRGPDSFGLLHLDSEGIWGEVIEL